MLRLYFQLFLQITILAPLCQAQVPAIVNYQGRIQAHGTNFTGIGQFKFALVDAGENLAHQATGSATVTAGFVTAINILEGGNGYSTPPQVTITGATGSGAIAVASIAGGAVTSITVQNAGSGYSDVKVSIASPTPSLVFQTFWSNDGTSIGGSEPLKSVPLPVQAGLFSLFLGDTNLPNMTSIPASVFSNPGVHLRVWFNDGVNGFAALTPDKPIGSVGYAMRADTAAAVGSNSIGSIQLQEGSITRSKLAAGVIPVQLPPTGPAGGDLAGTYPNPTLAPGAVSGNDIADGGVTLGKLSTVGGARNSVIKFDGTARVTWEKDSLQLPFTATFASTQSAIEIIDTNGFSSTGSAPLLRLDIRDTNTTRVGIRLTTAAHGVNAIEASTSGGGPVAVFSKDTDRPTGNGGNFVGSVLIAESRVGSLVTAAEFNALDTNNVRPAVDIEHRGLGPAIQVDATGTNIARFRHRRVTAPGASSTSTVIRFDETGKGFFNNGTQTGGADVAEAFDVEGDRRSYEPGDVLVISTVRDRQVTLTAEAYSALVAGVFATRPGVLLTESSIEADLSSQVPLAVIGVVPTKVCAENGPIRIGDLLVTSSRPGHAMKGDVGKIKDHPGSVIGKALENFNGTTGGLIRVLVNVR